MEKNLPKNFENQNIVQENNLCLKQTLITISLNNKFSNKQNIIFNLQ